MRIGLDIDNVISDLYKTILEEDKNKIIFADDLFRYKIFKDYSIKIK